MDIRLRSRLANITTFVFDVDGVFTDATLIVSENDVQRTFNVRDGYAIQMALKQGYNIAVITGGKQQSIATRLHGLGIKDVFLNAGTDQKLEVYNGYLEKNNIEAAHTVFVGDDIPDYLVMKDTETLAACPFDAVEEVQAIADYISDKCGGDGVVRDVIELVMKAQDKWLKVF